MSAASRRGRDSFGSRCKAASVAAAAASKLELGISTSNTRRRLNNNHTKAHTHTHTHGHTLSGVAKDLFRGGVLGLAPCHSAFSKYVCTAPWVCLRWPVTPTRVPAPCTYVSVIRVLHTHTHLPASDLLIWNVVSDVALLCLSLFF